MASTSHLIMRVYCNFEEIYTSVTALTSLVLHKQFKVAVSAVFSKYDLNITFPAGR